MITFERWWDCLSAVFGRLRRIIAAQCLQCILLQGYVAHVVRGLEVELEEDSWFSVKVGVFRCLTVTSSAGLSIPSSWLQRSSHEGVNLNVTLPTGTPAKTQQLLPIKVQGHCGIIKNSPGINIVIVRQFLEMYFNSKGQISVSVNVLGVFSVFLPYLWNRLYVGSKSHTFFFFTKSFRNHCNQIWAIIHWPTSRLRRRLDAVSSVRSTRPGTCWATHRWPWRRFR